MANEDYKAILRSLEENNQLCHSIEAKLDILISRSSGGSLRSVRTSLLSLHQASSATTYSQEQGTDF